MRTNKYIQILLIIILLVNIGCEKSSATDGLSITGLERFTLQCGDTYYRGFINEETKEILVEGITDNEAITGVSYQLPAGATITPKPEDVMHWNKTQTFSVVYEGGQSAQYTLNLPDLKDPVPTGRKAVIGYMPLSDWEFEEQYARTKWEYFTHINVSFALVKQDGTLDLSKVEERIDRVCDDAHRNGVKILISLAKATTGQFTIAISNPASRALLVENIIKFTKEKGLDGFDIDYEEYDNWNANFPSLLTFIRDLYTAKEKEEEKMLMTCAVVGEWLNYTKEWQQYFDYINLMSYDKGSFTETPVQHASYDSFVGDLNAWATTFAAPKSKIVGGLPFYGYSWDPTVPGDEVRAIRFCTIVDKFPGAEDLDVAGNKIYYNGRPTIQNKCKYVVDNDFGGVMIWQLFQDAHQDSKRLITVVGEEMN